MSYLGQALDIPINELDLSRDPEAEMLVTAARGVEDIKLQNTMKRAAVVMAVRGDQLEYNR